MRETEPQPKQEPTERQRRLRGKAAVAVTVFTAVAAGGLFATPAQAAPVYCGNSEYVEQIEVEPWADGHQKIKVYPTGQARRDVNPRHVTNSMWHAVQACVGGLYDRRADSIYDQLECHQHLALAKRYGGDAAGEYYTGPTYDLETWRGTFDAADWIRIKCGNELGKPEPAGPLDLPRRPDARAADPFSNIA